MEKKITFRLDKERFRLLRKLAEKEGFPVSLVVRTLVYRYLDDVKKSQVFKGIKG